MMHFIPYMSIKDVHNIYIAGLYIQELRDNIHIIYLMFLMELKNIFGKYFQGSTFVFGGYVRDLFSNGSYEKFNDLDIIILSNCNCENDRCEAVKEINEEITGYFFKKQENIDKYKYSKRYPLTFIIGNVKYKIDINIIKTTTVVFMTINGLYLNVNAMKHMFITPFTIDFDVNSLRIDVSSFLSKNSKKCDKKFKSAKEILQITYTNDLMEHIGSFCGNKTDIMDIIDNKISMSKCLWIKKEITDQSITTFNIIKNMINDIIRIKKMLKHNFLIQNLIYNTKIIYNWYIVYSMLYYLDESYVLSKYEFDCKDVRCCNSFQSNCFGMHMRKQFEEYQIDRIHYLYMNLNKFLEYYEIKKMKHIYKLAEYFYNVYQTKYYLWFTKNKLHFYKRKITRLGLVSVSIQNVLPKGVKKREFLIKKMKEDYDDDVYN